LATYIVTRDRPLDPIRVEVLSRLGEPLDDGLDPDPPSCNKVVAPKGFEGMATFEVRFAGRREDYAIRVAA